MPLRSNLKSAPRDSAFHWQANEEKKGSKPPTCSRCGNPMVWYHSRLKYIDGRAWIVHSFMCDFCGALTDKDEPKPTELRIV